MPSLLPRRQPDLPARDWFESAHGQVVLACEWPLLDAAGHERPGLPWLCIAPTERPTELDNRHLVWLQVDGGDALAGDVACATGRWPLASESVGTIVLQHAGDCGLAWDEALVEAARVLVPGGRLWLFGLNPLSPYRRYWWRQGITDAEPFTWRRRLRRHGFAPDAVAEGIGPAWNPQRIAAMQTGAGARAAYRLCAEKRSIPFTVTRARAPSPTLTLA
ncbi:hypothetical protein [Solilutibacter silvestris]|uniref:Methyltransferase domain-containing protein n=1 Tax=Solilutibacter silvestris TaxID=1645665 RepID=A0A2K1PZR8_9GAMM|nr:hypothetical protein [Lysobacter silvestris]PNS08288.1 hypothetical protein Lysil_2464 [Lysobacter silvestris]